MKKSIIFLVALCLTASFTACGNEENSSSVPNVSVNTIEEITAPANESESEKSENSTEEVLTESNVEIESTSGMLVAYFTYAENADLPDNADASASASIQSLNGKLTGNTGVVADMIAQKTGAELFSIQTVKSYPSDYDGTIDEGQAEKNNNEYPELSTHIENLAEYDTIFQEKQSFHSVQAEEADFLMHWMSLQSTNQAPLF